MHDLEKYYCLKENPFDIYSYLHKMANRKSEWGHIQRCFKSAFEGKGPKILLLLGDYGIGKTFMLEQIYGSFKDRRDVFVAHKNVLSERRLAIMESEPKWSKFGLDFITRIFDNIDRERLVEAFQKADFKKFKSKFVGVFTAIKNNDEYAFKYIRGQKLTPRFLQQLAVEGSIADSPTSVELYFDFLRAITLAEYNNFLLLIDEFEYIPSVLGEKKITQVLNTFRQIFDDFGNYERRFPERIAKPIFLFAVSPGGWETLKELDATSRKKTGGGGIAPFMERINERDIIKLKPFTLENTLELVEMRLSEARTKELEDKLFPFTKKCIGFVHEASFYKPRNIMQYCGILLEDGFEKGLKKIDISDAKKFLEQYGISSK